MQVYDRIIPNVAYNTLTLLMFGVGVAVMLEAILQYLRALTTAWSAARYERIWKPMPCHGSNALGAAFFYEHSNRKALASISKTSMLCHGSKIFIPAKPCAP